MIIFLLSVCDGSGYYFADSDNDCMYYQCTVDGDAHHKSCGEGLIWNNAWSTCTSPAPWDTYTCLEGEWNCSWKSFLITKLANEMDTSTFYD